MMEYGLYNTADSTAISENVLVGKSVYTSDGKIIGTMPNNDLLEIIPSTEIQAIPSGYINGGTVQAVTSDIDVNIIPENIKTGITILGVTGIYTGSDTESTES